MNAVYLCCISDVWLKTASMLKNDLDIDCKYFVGWKEDICKKKLKDNNFDCYCHFVEDAWRGIGFPSYIENTTVAIDELLFSEYSREIWIALKMIDRLDPEGRKFSFSERSYWFIGLIEKWLKVIEVENINIVISPSIPHRVFDYALYIAAKIKGLKFIMFQMTPFGDKSLIIDNIDATPLYLKQDDSDYSHVNLSEDIYSRLNVLFGDYESAKPDYMIKQSNESQKLALVTSKLKKLKKIGRAFRNANTYRIIQSDSPNYESISLLRHNFHLVQGEAYKKRLRKEWHGLSTRCLSMRSEDDAYVLVALHYQPEETSCPTGGFYAEQRQIVKVLDSVLPKHVKIYVKEHTSQFHPKMEGEAGRGEAYYKSLLGISGRIVLVDDREDTFKLIDDAIATVTVSGTIGWESVFRRTPTIVFGRAWFEDMPGVYKVKSMSQIESTFECINNNEMPSKAELIYYHKKLSHYLIASSHYKATADKGLTSANESAINIAEGIGRHLRNSK